MTLTLTERVARAIGAVDTTRHVDGRLLLKSHAQADAAIRETLAEAIQRVEPTGYRSTDLHPAGVWAGRAGAAETLLRMLAELEASDGR